MAGKSSAVSVVVRNAGRRRARNAVLRVLLSRDRKAGRGDVEIGRVRLRSVPARRTTRRVVQLSVPRRLNGAFSLIACVRATGDPRRSNDCRAVAVNVLLDNGATNITPIPGAPGSSTPPGAGGSGGGSTGGGTTPGQTNPPGTPSRWVPAAHTTWQIQLQDTVDTTIDAQFFDIDMFDNTADTVAALHGKGAKVSCYMSVGSWESFRPDQGDFPDSVKGDPLEPPFQDERWLDIRNLDVLGPIMRKRLDLCKAKGFDADDPDNVDGYNPSGRTGFPVTAADQLRYNRFIASEAHARGLAVGLKNDLDQIPQLVGDFDFAINEQCFEFNECDTELPFVNAGKPVFHIEYNRTTAQFCAQANAMGFMSVRKSIRLDAPREKCWT